MAPSRSACSGGGKRSYSNVTILSPLLCKGSHRFCPPSPHPSPIAQSKVPVTEGAIVRQVCKIICVHMPNGIASGLDPRHGNLGTWSSAFRLPVVQVLEFLAKEETAARKACLPQHVSISSTDGYAIGVLTHFNSYLATASKAGQRRSLFTHSACSTIWLAAGTTAMYKPNATGLSWPSDWVSTAWQWHTKSVSLCQIETEDTSGAAQAFNGTHAAASSYDLLAVQPTSERVLHQACTSLEIDIIAFDLAKRLPFRLKPGPLQAALKRGLFFEICYAPALREETARRNFFANALALARATRGKGIIISSGARSAFELRGPYDVINMATLFGLSEQDAKAALTTNCEAVLAHAESRKAYRGAVFIAATAGGEHQQPAPPANTASQQAGLGNQLSGAASTPRSTQNANAGGAGKAATHSTNRQRKRKSR